MQLLVLDRHDQGWLADGRDADLVLREELRPLLLDPEHEVGGGDVSALCVTGVLSESLSSRHRVNDAGLAGG